MRKPKIGEVPAHRIPIVSKSGDVVGNVGPSATTATVSRFLGHPRAKLGTFKGRTSWIEQGQNGRGESYKRPRRPSADYRHSRGSARPATGH